MHSSTTYTIFLTPPSHTLSPDYESTIDQFLTDVAADSGGDGNVYLAAPQYSDESSRAVYASTFGGTTEDTTTIGDACSKQYGSSYKVNGCLLDTDVQGAIQRALSAQEPVGVHRLARAGGLHALAQPRARHDQPRPVGRVHDHAHARDRLHRSVTLSTTVAPAAT